MSTVLTRDQLRERLDAFLEGTLSVHALAAWAFDQFYSQEEGTLVYEEGFEEVIGAVLDELMWADSAAFALDVEVARRLMRQITGL